VSDIDTAPLQLTESEADSAMVEEPAPVEESAPDGEFTAEGESAAEEESAPEAELPQAPAEEAAPARGEESERMDENGSLLSDAEPFSGSPHPLDTIGSALRDDPETDPSSEFAGLDLIGDVLRDGFLPGGGGEQEEEEKSDLEAVEG
jgi:hypothetical protein